MTDVKHRFNGVYCHNEVMFLINSYNSSFIHEIILGIFVHIFLDTH